jgi:hypothetical protein
MAGDGAATTAIENHTLTEMRDDRMVAALAEMISMSFAKPALILGDKNKNPKMSSLLLCYLKAGAQSERSKTEDSGGHNNPQ